MLGRQGKAAGGSGLPSWLSTHPSPEDRIERIRATLDTLSADRRAGTVGGERYLERIDGMVFGPTPRDGLFRDGTFLHPELAFRMDFPGDWERRPAPVDAGPRRSRAPRTRASGSPPARPSNGWRRSPRKPPPDG